jgi:hypothetical protein
MNRYIDHLQAVTTNNYNTIADFHTKSSQSTFTSNSSQQWLFLCSVFIRRFLAMNIGKADSSASVAQKIIVHNWTLYCLVAPAVLKITSRHGPRRKQPLYCCMHEILSNGCFSGSTVLARSKYATIYIILVYNGIRTIPLILQSPMCVSPDLLGVHLR